MRQAWAVCCWRGGEGGAFERFRLGRAGAVFGGFPVPGGGVGPKWAVLGGMGRFVGVLAGNGTVKMEKTGVETNMTGVKAIFLGKIAAATGVETAATGVGAALTPVGAAAPVSEAFRQESEALRQVSRRLGWPK